MSSIAGMLSYKKSLTKDNKIKIKSVNYQANSLLAKML